MHAGRTKHTPPPHLGEEQGISVGHVASGLKKSQAIEVLVFLAVSGGKGGPGGAVAATAGAHCSGQPQTAPPTPYCGL